MPAVNGTGLSSHTTHGVRHAPSGLSARLCSNYHELRTEPYFFDGRKLQNYRTHAFLDTRSFAFTLYHGGMRDACELNNEEQTQMFVSS
jgi:hypothetical protein